MADEKRIKNKIIKCRVTQEEYDIFLEKLKDTNLTISDYMRRLIFEGKINIIQPMSVIKMQGLGKEINKIGVNINQIAKIVNERGDYNKSDIKYLKEEHKKLQQLLFSRLYIHSEEEIEKMIISQNVKCIDNVRHEKYRIIDIQKNEKERGIYLVIEPIENEYKE